MFLSEVCQVFILLPPFLCFVSPPLSLPPPFWRVMAEQVQREHRESASCPCDTVIQCVVFVSVLCRYSAPAPQKQGGGEQGACVPLVKIHSS